MLLNVTQDKYIINDHLVSLNLNENIVNYARLLRFTVILTCSHV